MCTNQALNQTRRRQHTHESRPGGGWEGGEREHAAGGLAEWVEFHFYCNATIPMAQERVIPSESYLATVYLLLVRRSTLVVTRAQSEGARVGRGELCVAT